MSLRRTRQTPRPGKRVPTTARRAAAAKGPRAGVARPRAGRKGAQPDLSGITPAAMAGIGVALALAELMPRPIPSPRATRLHEDLDAEIAAVIAAALEASQMARDQAAESAPVPPSRIERPSPPGRSPSPWAQAGRMRQMGDRAIPRTRGRHG